MANNKANEYFLDILRAADLSGADYLAVLASLIDSAVAAAGAGGEIPDDVRRQITMFFEEYRIWHGIMDALS